MAENRGRLGEWVSAAEGFIEADVIRWTEGIYERRRGKKGKSRRLGERLVAAEVIEATNDGWLKLLVRACTVTKDDFSGARLPPLIIGETIKRARKTVERGRPERLSWTDESARRDVVRDQHQSLHCEDR